MSYVKHDFDLQEGIVPIQKKSADAAIGSEEEEDLALRPRKAMILHHKKKRKLKAKLRKKRNLEKLKLVRMLLKDYATKSFFQDFR